MPYSNLNGDEVEKKDKILPAQKLTAACLNKKFMLKIKDEQ